MHDKDVNYDTSFKHTCGVGTILYRAPEIGHGRVAYGHKSDIYSLALIGGPIVAKLIATNAVDPGME
ncbi:unnamed protein product [Oppiella nova]|uniref:Protein kinase domain-containing protein n=1 Tax=Oppiella nova TaxID=334625 RepID=A0A7R9QPF2_9ACAR|nr:unnamed protein product [Oppiella nova]CAG2170745.1 unnamed protein product [Oppiella nova]